MVFGMMGKEAEARVAMYLVSIDSAGPRRYQEYKLFSKGAALFAGIPMGELIFQGRNPGKRLKWHRLLVLASPNTEEAMVMFVFTAPPGEQDSFKKTFILSKAAGGGKIEKHIDDDVGHRICNACMRSGIDA